MNWVKRSVAAADRFQRRHAWLAMPVAVWKKFDDDQAGYLAALIAYFGFVAVFPMLLIFVTVLDITLRHDPGLRHELLNSALAHYPVIGNEINSNLGTLGGSGISLALGIIAALLGTRGAAGAMQNALCQVWGIPRDRRPGFPRSTLYGLALMLVIGGGFVVTTFLSGLAGGAGHVLSGIGAPVGAAAVSLVLNVGMFWLAFRLAAMRKVGWRNLRTGAAIAALVWQVLQVFGGYIVAHQLHRTSSLYGTFGVVLGLLAWLYLQAEITLYAAEVDVVLVRRLWPRPLLPGTGTQAARAQPAKRAHAARRPGRPAGDRAAEAERADEAEARRKREARA